MKVICCAVGILLFSFSCQNTRENENEWSGNPVFEGWYADPEVIVYDDKYYFMWSEGGWTGPDYRVAYAIADNPFGPFERLGTVLQQDQEVATGAGHHSVLNIPGTDEWYAVYHRRPLTETSPHHRVTCIDKMEFDEEGKILQVKITDRGVQARKISENKSFVLNRV